MNKLMLTTAIVAVTSMGAAAQTTETGAAQAGENVPAFLATDFTGKNLYTLDSDEARTLSEQRGQAGHGTGWESSDVFTADRDSWENVGNIDDMIVTMDGEIRGILIDVGGFLGIGARSVMVDIDDLYFVRDDADAEGIDDFFVVASMTEEQLEALPEWSEDQLSTGFEQRSYDSAQAEPGATMGAGHTTSMDDPQSDSAQMQTQDGMQGNDDMATQAEARTDVPAGYEVLSAEERTVDRLLGADVYGREGDNIATVDDLVMGDDGSVTHAVMDVGGFLGLGEHTVALEIDDIDILWNDEDGNVRVQLPMTQEEMESLPEYES
ncbi:PRC-barrel domain-containing protein [Roseinatronobacter bogoriensis]|nr:MULTISPECIES: PRC-barrel domain-containing protein [Rhodobaca]MBB4208962.1 uncharacterized protein YrrD [Rhodobaca bogoriensis DSM 18756]TDW37613.1 PRC-barrel domain protein [Rhodobaca barguzinensis]TDY68223.1 PRC-barrel domain protein [Rhodobaca bogoriensis DSM 18756]